MSHLAETIAAQPGTVERALALDLSEATARLRRARRIWLVGTGTSQHAAELGAWMFADGERVVRWASGAGFDDRPQAIGPDDGIVVISHTGETAFAQRARQRGLSAGAAVVSITAAGVGWPEAVAAAPRERSETYTASYLAALVVLARLSLALGESVLAEGALGELPAAVEAACAAPPVLDATPDRLLVIAGTGPGAITAGEGALKLREAARIPAEGFEAEYLLHGSAVPLGPGDALVTLDEAGERFGLLAGVRHAAAGAGVTVTALDGEAGLDPVLRQLPLTVRLQSLAASFAELRGADPDTVITGSWDDETLWRAGRPATAD